MNFLQPLFLYAFPLISLPILIHFFTRRKRTVIPFSTLRFLKLLENKRIRYLRIQQWILLLLRTAAAAFIIFAFSRPVLRGTIGASAGHTNTSAIFIIDNSLSMGVTIGNARRFDMAREYAEKIIASFHPEDEIQIWFPAGMDFSAAKSSFLNRERARSALQEGSLSYRRSNLSKALAYAHQTLKQETNANKEIYLFSDLQANEFDQAALEKDSLLSFTAVNFFMPPPRNIPDNIGVAGAKPLTQIIEPNKNLEIEASVMAKAASFPKEALLNVYLGDKRLTQRTITIEGQTAKRVTFNILPELPGMKQGYVEIEPDALDEDNRGYFTLHIPEKIKVLLVSNEMQEPPFFKLALDPQDEKETGALQVTSILHPLQNKSFAAQDILIFHDISKYTSSDFAIIKDYLQRGKGILIALSDRTDLSVFNSVIAEPLNIPKSKGLAGDPTSRRQYFTIDRLDLTHPIFQEMFEDKPKRLGPVHLYSAALFLQDSTSKVIAALQNEVPLLMEFHRYKGKILLFTGGMTIRSSDFPIKGLFSPLINRAVRYLALNEQPFEQYPHVGQPIRFGFNRRAQKFEIVRPDGEIAKPDVAAKGSGFIIEYLQTDIPGIYTLRIDDSEQDKIAVNIDPRESDLNAVPLSQLKRVLPRLHILPEEAEAALAAIDETRYGMELANFFALAALMCLIMEMWIARYRKEQRPLESPEEILSTQNS